MAVLVLGGDNSTDNSLSGADNTHTIAAETHSDFLIFNATDTTVDVRLVFAGNIATTIWTEALVIDLHSRIHSWNNHRDTMIDGNTFEVRALQPRAVFAVRQSNASTSAINYLDVSQCAVFNSGHGSNIYNGQEVHVAIYNNQSI